MPQRPLIGIDASRLDLHRPTGTETYTAELIAAMAALDPPDRFRLYLNAARPPDGLPTLGEPRCIPQRRLWTHLRLSREMATRAPDLLFVPAHVVPLVHPRSVVTIHDLGYLHEPEAHPPRQRLMLDATTRWSTRVAARVIAVSESTRRDLVERYRVSPDNVEVISLGVSDRFYPRPPSEIARVRTLYHLPERFVLSVGTIQPRKNLTMLARAMQTLPDLTLLVAGKQGWLADHVLADLAEPVRAGRVRLLGYLPSSDLPAMYAAADLVAFVSRFEGFGLPAIEAMACGTPVVVSDRGALPEVAGDAALVVDPDNRDQIAHAVRSVIDDLDRHARLRSAGLKRAERYTWRRTADATLALLRREAAD